MNPKHDEETSAIQAAETDDIQTGTSVVPVEEAEVDEDLVNEAYEKIERVVLDKMNSMMEEVGTYLLDAFFDGDQERAQNKNPTKTKSFSRLIDKLTDKHPSFGKKSSLYNAINVAIDLKRFENAGLAEYKQLGLTQKVYLTHVKDFDKKAEIAKEAAESNLSTRATADRIAQTKKNRARLNPEDLESPEAREKLKGKTPKMLKVMASSAKKNIEKLQTETEKVTKRNNERIQAWEKSEQIIREIIEEKQKEGKTKEKRKVKKAGKGS